MTLEALTAIVREALASVNASELRIRVKALPLYPKKKEQWSVTILGWLPSHVMDSIKIYVSSKVGAVVAVKLSSSEGEDK